MQVPSSKLQVPPGQLPQGLSHAVPQNLLPTQEVHFPCLLHSVQFALHSKSHYPP